MTTLATLATLATTAPQLPAVVRGAANGTPEVIPGGFIAAQFLRVGDLIERKGAMCEVLDTFRQAGRVLVALRCDLAPGELVEATIANGVMVQLFDLVTEQELAAYLGTDEGETVTVRAATPVHQYTHVRVRVTCTENGERVSRVGVFNSLCHGSEVGAPGIKAAIGRLNQESPANGRPALYLGYGDATITVLAA